MGCRRIGFIEMTMKHSLTMTLALTALLFVPAAAASDMDALRANVVSYYSAAGAAPDDPLMQTALGALESETAWITAEGLWRDDGSWNDINYAEIPSGVWSPWEHFRRLLTMAKAWSTPGQRFHRDPHLLLKIERALTYLDTFYARTGKVPGNWWFWSLGPALDLGPALVLVSEDVKPSVRESATKVIEMRIGKRPGVTNEGVTLVGQNRVWSAMNHMMLAILRDDAAKMSEARSILAFETVPGRSAEGLRVDNSFHQHGAQLYTGGYGGSFAYEVTRFSALTRGTAWAPLEAIDSLLTDYVVEGIAWSLYQNYFDVSVVGREVAYPTASGFNGLAALLHASLVPSRRQAEIRSAAAMMLRTWDGPLRTELAAIAGSLRGVEPTWPAGLKIYPESDYVVHRRPGWFASVRMFSTRTISGEVVNNENLVGSRQSDGRFNLVVDGDEYLGGNVRPTLDWSRLPGITVEQRFDAANSTYGRGTRAFVGGVSNGWTGVAAMDLAPVGSQLSARKAWIFFDDSIVFLTSGVTCLTGNRAETIVDQRAVRSGEALVTGGGALSEQAAQGAARWAVGEKVGYFFPGPGEVQVVDETRHGSWVMLARSNPQGLTSNRIRTMLFDHGTSVTDGAAEYVIVPGVDAEGMRAWADARPVTILRNDRTAAAARDERTGEVGIVFWEAGEAAGLTVDRPVLVHRKDAGAVVTLSIADPARASARVRVVLPESLRLVSGNATAELAARKTTLDVPLGGGRTSTIVLSRTFRSRGVTR
jgi:chondroitin AC lyase